MFTLLFFDDFYLHQRTNLSRHVGQPILLREGTLHDPHVDPAWGYPTVFQDRESGAWRCVYQGQTANGRSCRWLRRAMMASNGTCPIWPR